ncbi:4-hydroxybenzoate octaprenyltransferase [Thiomicrorhabdus sp. zzn3]|uniref:4-hydroxybenzoate octaprenyltransferase n=1 Tax=Thiomicrorhabdus sp. zzn3 TaxID=3039775 RepID=UPI0024372E2D|nr:4-hydroxybenzoate octaprenyltransferase [Thiomicrorhabdus sp. zzn3]MDG6778701.1 4-hydroxybenzoate octaprenyltransferase [Thiomicrorhabdus sp. zzn3]
MMSKWQAYIALTRINRPVGIYLVLWPALWALWLAAGGMPPLWVLVVFILGAVLMRSAGCVINDYADRNFDGNVRRTCQRPLATGAISVKEALGFFVVLCVIAFLLVLTLNTLTILLSFGAVVLAAVYPFMKRHTYWPQAFLGAAFAWAIPMAFAAVQDRVPWQAWPLFVATLVWSLIYDTAYAVADKEDDLKVGIKSTAILFDKNLVPMIAFFQMIMLGLLIWTGLLFSLGLFYYLGLFIVAGLFFWHSWRLLTNDPHIAFQVFLQNHWIGVIILLGLIADSIWLIPLGDR